MKLYKEPNRHTCPDIDYVISAIRLAINITESKSSIEGYTYEERMGDIYHALVDLEKMMEHLREENSILRNWGNELVSHAENLDSVIDKQQEEINYLIDTTP